MENIINIRVCQLNTNKQRIYQLDQPLCSYEESDFKLLIAIQESIPVGAINFVKKDETTNSKIMNKLYPKDVVFYFALDYQPPWPINHILYGSNYVTAKIRNQIIKVYPFAVHATDAMISFLLESNRINSVDENIKEMNAGIQFEDCDDEMFPYMEKVSYLNIQDICIRPMQQ